MDVGQEIDEGLYSRQLYVLGREAVMKLGGCDVLISGLGGLGLEIAKNLILAGVRSVTLHDLHALSHSDLSSQFFASESDVGKNRAEVSRDRLAELNGHVRVTSHDGQLTDSHITRHGAVILTEATKDENVRIGRLCHDNSIYFLSANVAGVFGQIFCDFGENFEIKDKISQPPSVAQIEHISKDGQKIFVHLEKECRASFAENDLVSFDGIEGTERGDRHRLVPIKEVINSHVFVVEEMEGFPSHASGGIVTEVRVPEVVRYKPFEESLSDPTYTSNGASNDELLHLAFQALQRFQAKNGRLPKPRSRVDAAQFTELCSNLKEEQRVEVRMDEGLLSAFSMCSSANLCPMQSIIGSIAAQEIIKAVTRKFEPVHQWFYFGATEVLPPDYDQLDEDDCTPTGSRYDGQIAVLGKKHQEAIMDAKLFMVGVGAIGCEMLKNWSMMGIGSGQRGRVVITDMDGIERSNLNRQFLFRPEHIGCLKSTTAAEMVHRLLNADMKVEARGDRVCEETADAFDDDFFESVDVLVNALDNVAARLYMAERSVYYGKPLLESGTEGTRCHVQVILPGLTRSYARYGESAEDNIPLCTVKYFPTSIEHTIQWARDNFEGYFKLGIKTLADFLQDENFLENTRRMSGVQPVEKLKELLEVIEGFQKEDGRFAANVESCVRWARLKFEKNFNSQVEQLRHNFPPDAVTDKGVPFWHGMKRCPVPIAFRADRDLHVEFVTSAANVMASGLGLSGSISRQEAARVASSMDVPQFTPNSGVVIPATDEEAKEQQNSAFDEEEFNALAERLPERSSLKDVSIRPTEIDFEKDSDGNFHVEFITSASNLRAENYSIPPKDKLETKRIVGKIIPAIATTTSLVVGLVCLELLKILTGQKDLKKYKDWYCQMSSCFVQPTGVGVAKKSKYNDVEFSFWDHFCFDDITISELIGRLKTEHKLNVDGVFYGKSVLLSSLTLDDLRQERLGMRISEAIRKVSGSLAPHLQSVQLDVMATDEKDEDVEDPPFVKVKFDRRN